MAQFTFQIRTLNYFTKWGFFLFPSWTKSFISTQSNLLFYNKQQLHLPHPNITKTHRNHMWKPKTSLVMSYYIFLAKRTELLFNVTWHHHSVTKRKNSYCNVTTLANISWYLDTHSYGNLSKHKCNQAFYIPFYDCTINFCTVSHLR
jgi:hypothetical protein